MTRKRNRGRKKGKLREELKVESAKELENGLNKMVKPEPPQPEVPEKKESQKKESQKKSSPKPLTKEQVEDIGKAMAQDKPKLEPQNSQMTSTPPESPKATKGASRELPFRPASMIGREVSSKTESPPPDDHKNHVDAYSKFMEEHVGIADKPDDSYLARLKEFVDTEWGLPGVTMLFRGLFSGGYAPIPIPTQWAIPSRVDIVELVWQQVQNHKFLDEMWPSIKMLMNDNLMNTQWTAQVATILAFYRVIKILPIAMNGFTNE